MTAFRELTQENSYLINNFRPAQPLNGRVVYEMDTTPQVGSKHWELKVQKSRNLRKQTFEWSYYYIMMTFSSDYKWRCQWHFYRRGGVDRGRGCRIICSGQWEELEKESWVKSSTLVNHIPVITQNWYLEFRAFCFTEMAISVSPVFRALWTTTASGGHDARSRNL